MAPVVVVRTVRLPKALSSPYGSQEATRRRARSGARIRKAYDKTKTPPMRGTGGVFFTLT
jgi:hypothetical protein